MRDNIICSNSGRGTARAPFEKGLRKTDARYNPYFLQGAATENENLSLLNFESCALKGA